MALAAEARSDCTIPHSNSISRLRAHPPPLTKSTITSRFRTWSPQSQALRINFFNSSRCPLRRENYLTYAWIMWVAFKKTNHPPWQHQAAWWANYSSAMPLEQIRIVLRKWPAPHRHYRIRIITWYTHLNTPISAVESIRRISINSNNNLSERQPPTQKPSHRETPHPRYPSNGTQSSLQSPNSVNHMPLVGIITKTQIISNKLKCFNTRPYYRCNNSRRHNLSSHNRLLSCSNHILRLQSQHIIILQEAHHRSSAQVPRQIKEL